MPTLHRFANHPGHFVKGIMKGQSVAFQLTPEGEEYLTETLSLSHGSKFAGDTLKWLFGKKWAELLDYVPQEAGTPASVPTPPPAEPSAAPPVVQETQPNPPPVAPTSPPVPPPATAPVPAPAPPVPAVPELNEVVFQGVFRVRLTALDQTLLDQAALDVVRMIGKTGVSVLGPIPLPVQVESYIVQRDEERKCYEVRLYRRLLQVRNPRRRTVEVMNNSSLPREVDLQVEMQPGTR